MLTDLKINKDDTEPILLSIDRSNPSPEPQIVVNDASDSQVHSQSKLGYFPPYLSGQSQVWSSPAFLKRKILTDISIFDAVDGFLAESDGFAESYGRKRTKFGRASGQWRLIERTPSPEVEIHRDMDNQAESFGVNLAQTTEPLEINTVSLLSGGQVSQEQTSESQRISLSQHTNNDGEQRTGDEINFAHASHQQQTTATKDTPILSKDDLDKDCLGYTRDDAVSVSDKIRKEDLDSPKIGTAQRGSRTSPSLKSTPPSRSPIASPQYQKPQFSSNLDSSGDHASPSQGKPMASTQDVPDSTHILPVVDQLPRGIEELKEPYYRAEENSFQSDQALPAEPVTQGRPSCDAQVEHYPSSPVQVESELPREGVPWEICYTELKETIPHSPMTAPKAASGTENNDFEISHVPSTNGKHRTSSIGKESAHDPSRMEASSKSQSEELSNEESPEIVPKEASEFDLNADDHPLELPSARDSGDDYGVDLGEHEDSEPVSADQMSDDASVEQALSSNKSNVLDEDNDVLFGNESQDADDEADDVSSSEYNAEDDIQQQIEVVDSDERNEDDILVGVHRLDGTTDTRSDTASKTDEDLARPVFDNSPAPHDYLVHQSPKRRSEPQLALLVNDRTYNDVSGVSEEDSYTKSSEAAGKTANEARSEPKRMLMVEVPTFRRQDVQFPYIAQPNFIPDNLPSSAQEHRDRSTEHLDPRLKNTPINPIATQPTNELLPSSKVDPNSPRCNINLLTPQPTQDEPREHPVVVPDSCSHGGPNQNSSDMGAFPAIERRRSAVDQDSRNDSSSSAIKELNFQVIEDREVSSSKGVGSDFMAQKNLALKSTPDAMPSETSQQLTSKPSLLPLAFLSTGFTTPLSHFIPLSTLSQYWQSVVDVLAIVIASQKPIRAKAGPRDYYQTLFIVDPSVVGDPKKHQIITIRIFRPSKNALPVVETGDALLLRNFQIRTHRRRPMLQSTNTSAWAVFRKEEQAQIRGPPIELGPEERGFAKGLRDWWLSRQEEVRHELVNAASRRKEISGEKGKGPANLVHELRDGTKYIDGDTDKEDMNSIHELRDGTIYHAEA